MTRAFAALLSIETDGVEVSMVRADGFTLSAILAPVPWLPSRLTPKRRLHVKSQQRIPANYNK
jgi:hypothetical protein